MGEGYILARSDMLLDVAVGKECHVSVRLNHRLVMGNEKHSSILTY